MNEIRKKLESNSFVTLAELQTPKGTDTETFIKNAKSAEGLVDAFLIPDIPNAIMRMSSFSAACLLQKNNMNSIIQLNCRDRNQLALQADMLGAYANGFETLMIVQGEDPKTGDHHQAKGVYDVSLVELFRTAQGMSEGFDLAGMELEGSANFLVGAYLELSTKISDRFQIKNTITEYMEAGVSFFVTQPVFNTKLLADFYSSVKDLKPVIFPTVLLLKSLGMARYMARNVSTIDISPELIKRLQKSKDKTGECLNISREIISSIKELGLQGVVIQTLGWENKLPGILS